MTDDEKPPELPFATTEDLEARWHPLTESETSKARTLLADASDLIMTQCPRWREASDATLKRIACQMVKRAMLALDRAGVSQSTQTAGSFSESMSYSNPDGDLYLTSAERKSLGKGVQTAFHIHMGGVA
ncbi:hypothetical protein H7U32_06280 [Bifidobacterium pullorum subsp. saeculare]|uniref:Phage protein Gp19/Gp15/Gp42 n=1 Tax=Bifidobacterium pullorum subsp. saeculare TaxID=78257 RepID=A0A939B9V3_9BIFI|nr:Gp19/Gp15/Gp42 family protein [Bifidobacterium pullorum]MBM6699918.1 hypothetical protein [Bifidobacterium pullorum subsp. saeculare]